MNERSLHSAIKEWYSLPGDRFEVRVDGFIIDIARGDLLIEIQTKNFSALKKKLASLVENHRVRVVFPIPKQKWIVKVTELGEPISRRRSPRKGKLTDLFYELVSFPHLIKENNLSLEVLMTSEEEVRCSDGKGSWRRRGVSIKDRRLISVDSRTLFRNEGDFLRCMPDFSTPFTNRSLAKDIGVSIVLARKITYCLRRMGAIEVIGKSRRELTFEANLDFN